MDRKCVKIANKMVGDGYPCFIIAEIGINHNGSVDLAKKMIDNNVNEKWISIDDAAEYLGVKPVTIRDWIRKGKDIPAHKIGKQWKFKCSELDAWVKSGHSAE